jgi:anti-sigma factor RsiW
VGGGAPGRGPAVIGRGGRPSRHRPACRDVVELVTDYLEGAITPELRARLDEHLRACRHCAEYLRQMRTMVRAVGRLAAPALDPRGRDDLVAAFRRWTAA